MWRQTDSSDELYHHGIKGQKWGVRRYQNPDGTLTAAGKVRYRTDLDNKKAFKQARKEFSSAYEKRLKANKELNDNYRKRLEEQSQKELGMSYDEAFKKAVSENDDIYSGKLDYKDSTWAKLNRIEYDADEAFHDKGNEIENVFKKEKLDAGKKFVDQYFKNNPELTYQDLTKMYSKKHYNAEHDEWQNDWAIDEMLDTLFDMPDMDFNFEGDTLKVKRRKR